MSPPTIKTALKEWAVVQRSLLEGHQIILLRKGGLIEESGEFDLRAPWFFLFPTYLHETERSGDLQPCFHVWLAEEEGKKPPKELVRLEAAAHVTDVVRADDRSKLLHLSPQHIWSQQFVHGRYDWEPYKPIFALLLRVYQMPVPFLIPNRKEFGGCRSWVELPDALSTKGAVPVLPDASYQRRRELTLRLLQADTP